MLHRFVVAFAVGMVAAIVLECVNGFFTFLVPPLIVISPLCLVTSLIIAETTTPRQNLND